ncbi:Zn-dependent hydrolase [Streptomyces jumonjinensis]|uniref:Zn-dependent hydrolase n=1 Tax=Streptomyces jumonjinensis TaxID=1945 RepID=UPI001886A9AD|nr:Zn-dependent hydrolase [Streptomyces jumonjinensis]
MTHHRTAPPTVDGGRLLRRVEELGNIGRDPATGGITREGYSPADREARAYVVEEARAAGLTVSVDAAGNIFIRAQPAGAAADRPALLMGSHLDTVVGGGRLDGAYGVLAALEVVQACAEFAAESRYEPMAVAFTNEEGALFPQPFFGASVLSGRLADLPREPLDHNGRSLRGPLALAGGDLYSLGSAVWPAESVAAYLELHIEQGPVLERTGNRIGVVNGITGRTVLTVEIHGMAGHAGTVPMAGRCDALAAASRAVLAVERIASERDLCRVATVGRLVIHPNSPNTIADRVRLTVDLRDTVASRMDKAETALRQELRNVARQTGAEIEVVARTHSGPVSTNADLRALIEESCLKLGVPYESLPSGAGHDAQVVADIAPVAMIFVPSIGGASHVPHEDTDPADLVVGAEVLLHTALTAAGVRTTR